MKNQPLISVIIPVYNVEQYLEECMNSILAQTYETLDIILVDDGSKDHSAKMCDDYAKTDSRVQVIHKENGGLMSAWMAGVKIARGEYLAFVDSDDWVELNMMEELVRHTTGIQKEVICSNYIIEKTQKNQSIKMKQSIQPGIYNREALEQEVFPCLLGLEERKIHASRCMKLISKELIKNNMQYADKRVTMGEDLNIMLPALLDAERVVILEEGFFYHYRFVDASMVHKYNPDLCFKIELLYQALEKMLESKISGTKEKEFYRTALKKEYIFLMFLVLKNELRGPGKNCVKRIRQMIQTTKEKAGLESVEADVKGKASTLLYGIWKHPGRWNITITRWIIYFFDRK